MSSHALVVRQALEAVRRRWQLLATLRLASRVALGTAALWLLALALTWIPGGGPAVLVGAAAAAVVASVAWVALQLVRRPAPPADRDLARLIEEHYPDLDDRVASAVDVQRRGAEAAPALADALMVDAARAVSHVVPGDVVPSQRVRRAAWRAAAACTLCALLAVAWWGPGHRAYHASRMYLFPGTFALEVTPGDARVRPGEVLTIGARTTAARGGVTPDLTVRVGDEARTVPMARAGDDEAFAFVFDPVPGSFTYQVRAAGRTSPEYTVTLLSPPRVRQIDLQYTYPAFTKLPPRTETDGGDVYAPEGTAVQVIVHPVAPIASGALVLGETRVPLVAGRGDTLIGDLRVTADGSYRVALADHDGLTSPGDTEYFIRVLTDRPPDVRILRPAGDRHVTPLEEVTIEARADDDYGIALFDLVYAVRGGAERTVPFEGERSALTATGRHTLHLEDLGVEPGDFVTYYARVRDIGRGRRSAEARSDIFFLEVKPFEEEFAMAQTQAMSGAGGGGALDDLVSAQKEIIVATWKLERRSGAGRSAEDVKAVARAQGELKARAARESSQTRDPRRRFRLPSTGEPPVPEADPLTQAVAAMGRAEDTLAALKVAEAIPSEMEALNHLLRAEAEIKRREVARQQANGGGGGGNRPQQDLSTLFDRELRRQQQTNYETPRTAEEQRENGGNDALDRVRELARRQEQLARQQDDLARDREELSSEELKRRLERLTREQTELRRQAEQLARQMAEQQRAQQQRGERQRGEQANGQSQGAGAQADASRLREASEEMRGAAADLRRDDPEQARARSARALDRLRATERQLQGSQPDERRRALGDMQLEARQLAEQQRRMAAQDRQQASANDDGRRRLAGEQERLADRMQRLEEQVRDLASSAGQESQAGGVARAAREAQEQQLSRRMRDLARQLRDDAPGADGSEAGRAGEPKARATDDSRRDDDGRPVAGDGRTEAGPHEAGGRTGDRPYEEEGADLARGIERLADRLSEAGGMPRAGDEQRLSDQLARARDVRERLAELQRRVEQLQREDEQATEARAAQRNAQQDPSREGRGTRPGAEEREGTGERGQAEGQQARAGASSGGTGGSEVERLQQEYSEQLREVARLQQEVQSSRTNTGGGGMSTPEGQQMSLSAPGTEAFKQDFSRWEILHRGVTDNLQRLEATLSQQLLERALRDRVQAGGAEAAPEEYHRAVERYFKSLATPKP
jgi:hypothetical protein